MSKKETRKQRGRIKEQVVLPVAEPLVVMPNGYADFIAVVKHKISAQVI